jgi:high-affinity iron transporter
LALFECRQRSDTGLDWSEIQKYTDLDLETESRLLRLINWLACRQHASATVVTAMMQFITAIHAATPAFVITLREGLEAFLIVAISLAYLRKAGRHELVAAVRWGIALAILISIGAAFLLQRAANQSLWEGVLAIVAAVSVASLTVHMWRAARRIKHDIEGHLRGSTLKTGTAAFLGVLGFTTLMIAREGMETALLMGALLFQVQSVNIVGGAIVGTLSAALVAWSWSRFGHRVNLGLFFQVTAVFLLVFVVQLLIYGFHELTEANIFPYSETLHWATEPYGPDGRYGQYLTYLLVMLPLGWLVISSLMPRRVRQQPSAQNV